MGSTDNPSRRDFMKTSLSVPLIAGAIGSTAGLGGCANSGHRGNRSPHDGKQDARHASLSADPRDYDMREELQPRRITNAMWDFSWLNGHHPGGPFEDWDRTLDELVERRFNAVRIEAFPHIIGSLKSRDEKRPLPANPDSTWGQSTIDHEHAYALELVEFMRKCKDRNIGVILSTWGAGGIPCPENATGDDLHRPFQQAWERTLDLLGENDLLGPVLYVDLDQEFPYFSYYEKRIAALAGKGAPVSADAASAMEAAGRRAASMNTLAWDSAQMGFVSTLLSVNCQHFQMRYPQLRFTYSLTGFWKEVRAMGLTVFDVLELHTWIHSPRFEARSGFNKLTKDRGAHDYKDYMRRLRATMASSRPMLMKAMRNQMKYAQEWSEEIAAPLVTTEAWGPWWHMDNPDLEWDWLYEWCEECMAVAPAYGFWAITPWNYSHPYWTNWENVEWYQRVNGRFLES